jgi:hypothetical protein
MKFKGQLEWTDYLNAQLLHMQPGKLAQTLFYGVAALVGCGLIGMLYLFVTGQLEYETTFLAAPVLVFAAVIPLYRYVLLPRRIKKLFIQQKELSLPFELEITETGMFISNELGNGTRPWANFTQWKENEKLLLLYHSDVMFSIIPKRVFSDPQQVETVKAFLEKNKVPAAKGRSTATYIIYIILFLAVVWLVYSNLRGR